ncbi:Sec-independent protein translocase protein TatC [Pilimelia terevasa]|uniref:Sec-independent protein translocase protein TatC n=1 Tax=Pilimelia terevasa TaxID=53372 RepID=A0A8J3BTS8_9ACTN|nr:twin-arginine translocase subunit TatC [Pilimelia terevasa]GGK42517.1 Sec-independent protein translocase protein TatC [Pilimelia terevasa]
MAFGLRRRDASKFTRAADGSMTLVEHIRELRDRLFWAALAIAVGFGIGLWTSGRVLEFLQEPYCNLPSSLDAAGVCRFVQLGPADVFLLKLKVALWVGLIVAAPVWLYQLWAFIAPGLHRHERRYAYAFTAMAAPLFGAGAVLAFFVVEKGLEFLMGLTDSNISTTLEMTRYVSFVTNLVLIFGVAFEFPLVAVMLNVVGVASGRRLLGWWRPVVFLFFVFAAVVTPTPDPFGMTALALCLSVLYFLAVGFALLNDRRRRRKEKAAPEWDDDEVSPLAGTTPEEIPASEPYSVAPVPASEFTHRPLPVEARYDEVT